MALVVTQEGAQAILTALVSESALSVLYVHLLGSSYTVLHTSTLSALTAAEVPAGGGYAPIAVPIASGEVYAPDAVGAIWTGPIMQWLFTTTTAVWGYFIAASGAGVSLWGENFVAPFSFGGSGGLFSFQPSATLHSQPPWPPTTNP